MYRQCNILKSVVLLKFSLVSIDVGLFKKPRKRIINVDTYSHTAWRGFGVDLTWISGKITCVGHFKGLNSFQGCC